MYKKAKNVNKPFIKLIVKKYCIKHVKFFRSLKICYNYSRLVYRYPYRFDNDGFIQKLCLFIENDLITNNYHELNAHYNVFYVDVIDGNIKFVNKLDFEKKENTFRSSYIREAKKVKKV